MRGLTWSSDRQARATVTETDWLCSFDPEAMMEFLRGRASERKLRLLDLDSEVIDEAVGFKAHVVARVVRVFRGHERIRVGDSVEFDVDAALQDRCPPGSYEMVYPELLRAKFLEVFLDGE